MEILDQFGFDIKLFVAQIVNFLVIVYLFKKFLYKPIIDTLDKRNSIIKKGLKDAEDSANALIKAEEDKDKIIKEARRQAEEMMEEAKKQTSLLQDEMIKAAKNDITRMMDETREQIKLEKENFKKESMDLSLEISEKILKGTISSLFDKKQKEEILKRGIGLLKHDKQTKN